MGPRLFEDLIDSHVATHRANRARVWPVSVGLHGLTVAAIVLLPILQASLLPKPASAHRIILVEPRSALLPPPSPPRRAGAVARRQPVFSQPVIRDVGSFMAPVPVDLEMTPEGDLGLGVEGGVVGGVLDGVVGGVFGAAPAPPAPPQQAIRPGGQIQRPRKLKNVDPVYPEIAMHARVQGVVILECTISPQGEVTGIRVLRGIPLLNNAATTAVKEWIFTPTRLNGVPVPVILTVTVNFTLS